jgi:hypothetical protein
VHVFYFELMSSVTALAKPPIRVVRCDGEHRFLDCDKDFNFVAGRCVTFKGWQAMAEVGLDCVTISP